MNDHETIRRNLKARRTALIFFGSAFFSAFLLGFICLPIQQSHPSLLLFVGILLPLCFITVVSSMAYLLVMYKCPQCGKPFASKWWYGNAFTTKCLHCGVRLDCSNIK